jgi:hypothetical protein
MREQPAVGSRRVKGCAAAQQLAIVLYGGEATAILKTAVRLEKKREETMEQLDDPGSVFDAHVRAEFVARDI